MFFLTDSPTPPMPNLDPDRHKLVAQQKFRGSDRRQTRPVPISPAMQQANELGNTLKTLMTEMKQPDSCGTTPTTKEKQASG